MSSGRKITFQLPTESRATREDTEDHAALIPKYDQDEGFTPRHRRRASPYPFNVPTGNVPGVLGDTMQMNQSTVSR